jgi:hypothetical protein
MKPAADIIEDLEFLDDANVGAVEAARRTDFPTPHALEKWLERQGRSDLWLSLKRRDPEGTHLSGSDRAKAREQATVTTINPTDVLLAEAAKHGKASIRRKGERIAEMLTELSETLRAEREDAERRSAALKEVNRLERQLAEARAKLKGRTILDVDSSVSAAELRAWASRNGYECPARGRVPSAVREAYEAAQESEAVAS